MCASQMDARPSLCGLPWFFCSNSLDEHTASADNMASLLLHRDLKAGARNPPLAAPALRLLQSYGMTAAARLSASGPAQRARFTRPTTRAHTFACARLLRSPLAPSMLAPSVAPPSVAPPIHHRLLQQLVMATVSRCSSVGRSTVARSLLTRALCRRSRYCYTTTARSTTAHLVCSVRRSIRCCCSLVAPPSLAPSVRSVYPFARSNVVRSFARNAARLQCRFSLAMPPACNAASRSTAARSIPRSLVC
jgi:hypothetical protein